jgi:superfamily II DNA or RNA helicase
MPISWKGTLQQYVGRLHRLHDAKRVVQIYDYVDSRVLILARMYAPRLRGYSAIGQDLRRRARTGIQPSSISRFSSGREENGFSDRMEDMTQKKRKPVVPRNTRRQREFLASAAEGDAVKVTR